MNKILHFIFLTFLVGCIAQQSSSQLFDDQFLRSVSNDSNEVASTMSLRPLHSLAVDTDTVHYIMLQLKSDEVAEIDRARALIVQFSQNLINKINSKVQLDERIDLSFFYIAIGFDGKRETPLNEDENEFNMVSFLDGMIRYKIYKGYLDTVYSEPYDEAYQKVYGYLLH